MNRSDDCLLLVVVIRILLYFCARIYVGSLHSPNRGKHLIKLATLIQLDDTTHRPVVASSHKLRPYKKDNEEVSTIRWTLKNLTYNTNS